MHIVQASVIFFMLVLSTSDESLPVSCLQLSPLPPASGHPKSSSIGDCGCVPCTLLLGSARLALHKVLRGYPPHEIAACNTHVKTVKSGSLAVSTQGRRLLRRYLECPQAGITLIEPQCFLPYSPTLYVAVRAACLTCRVICTLTAYTWYAVAHQEICRGATSQQSAPSGHLSVSPA